MLLRIVISTFLSGLIAALLVGLFGLIKWYVDYINIRGGDLKNEVSVGLKNVTRREVPIFDSNNSSDRLSLIARINSRFAMRSKKIVLLFFIISIALGVAIGILIDIRTTKQKTNSPPRNLPSRTLEIN